MLRISAETRKKIKIIFIDEDITLTEVAEKMGMDRSSLANRISGRYKFKEDEKKKLAEILHKTVEEIFG